MENRDRLEDVVEARRRAEFFAQLEEDFRRLRSDPAASAAYDAELALWDSTLLDGLEDAPLYRIVALVGAPGDSSPG